MSTATMWTSGSSTKVHIRLEGYRPVKSWKRRDGVEFLSDRPLCSAALTLPLGASAYGRSPMECIGDFDDPITPRGRTLCPECLGRLITERRAQGQVIELLRSVAVPVAVEPTKEADE